MSRSYRWTLVLLVAGALSSAPALAHKESDAYLTLATSRADRHAIEGQWDIALRDLDFALGIDDNRDGAITWGEVRAHRAEIERYALARLVIRGDGLTCELHPRAQAIDEHTDGAYDVIFFRAVCDKDIPSRLAVDYALFRDIDPYHRGIVTIHADGVTTGAVLGPENPKTTLDLRAPDRWKQFGSFVTDGIWHIWTGVDHLLFILSLLLPAVMIRRRVSAADGGRWDVAPGGSAHGVRTVWRERVASVMGRVIGTGNHGREGLEVAGLGVANLGIGAAVAIVDTASQPRERYEWFPVASWWRAFIDVVKVISAFTLSHSVTLTLAVLGIVDLPSRLVESAIALSIIVAAANNLFPVVRQRVWLIAFAFGFVHGLGFASALSGLQLPPLSMAASLGGFNVGVEIGQEAIVLTVMPLAFLARGTRFYRDGVLRWGSLLIIALAAGWLIQRAFNVSIPIFSALLPS